ncbi:PhzF family phenazine biosynthesis protein [Pseudovibrio exalbescens]|uniref:Phenazine biosynthesis protein PhzF n=1 Tax=Pseudovibrio exalbescens TaxID=197461 RepID=A0A1U7JKU6_9HYPH|nr:PhzF family phenazine biosynthesis protein [Pseudovibrio exalbescens]OKL45363.1 phenazine biosynthesis protein PhzF [Pseudovibrio exalbescens]
MSRRYALLDVFTNKPLEGNQLAIVQDCNGLSDEEMQALAREFNLSETVFLLPPENPAHSAKLRIFTPFQELPFAGHPTVGAAVFLSLERFGNDAPEQDSVVVLEETLGTVRCGVVLKQGAAGFAEFDVPSLPRPSAPMGTTESIALCLGIEPTEIGFENHHPTTMTAGNHFAFVPVRDLSVLKMVSPDPSHWEAAFGNLDHNAVYIYCRETETATASFQARMFSNDEQIWEDAATGSAAAAFGGVVHAFDEPLDGTHHFTIEQGFQMGRPSVIDLELDIEGKQIRAQRIGGQAVLIARGELFC